MADITRGVAIGIDAGGTKTVGILVDGDGREISRAHAGGANPYDVGPEAARLALASVLEPLLAGGKVRAVCLGSAGVDSEPERKSTEAVLRGLVPEDVVIVVKNDAAAALGLVGPKRPAMVVIAATGSIAYGEGVDGKVTRVGGHGAIIGDSGSGSALGLGAVKHTANAYDGSEPKGKLAAAVIDRLKLRRASDIVARIQHPDLDVPLLASLAPLVEEARQGGDTAAKMLVEAEGTALAASAKRLAYSIREQSTLPVLLVGNIFSGFPEIREKVKASLRQTGPVMIHEFSECVLGAARVALEMTSS